MEFSFVINSALLGAGLAMDAFSVSVANGLNDPKMSRLKAVAVALTYAFFQALMPLLGWVCVHTVLEYFNALNILIPWIAFVLLSFIGGKMVLESLRDMKQEKLQESGEDAAVSESIRAENNRADEKDGSRNASSVLSPSLLIVQGIATSIDALSVGFAIAHYDFNAALFAALIISVVTFFICVSGIYAGRTIGNRFSGKASLLGGVILILIGLEIFVSGVFL